MLADRRQAFPIELRFVCGGLEQFVATRLHAVRTAPTAAVQAAFSGCRRAGSHTCHSMTYMTDTRLRRVNSFPLTQTLRLTRVKKKHNKNK